MNPSLNYHASQARIDDMHRRSAQLQGIEREKEPRSRGRVMTVLSSLTPKPSRALRPSGAPATHKA